MSRLFKAPQTSSARVGNGRSGYQHVRVSGGGRVSGKGIVGSAQSALPILRRDCEQALLLVGLAQAKATARVDWTAGRANAGGSSFQVVACAS